jgi:6-phospho-beta-glucosidase
LGVGGISAGWRTWPVLAPILEAIARYSPRALVVLLTSPLSILVRASLNHADLNLVGICELPWTTLQQLSNSSGVTDGEIQADYLGVNHLGWFFNIRPELAEFADALTPQQSPFPASQFFRHHACFPTRYLRLHYEPEKVLAEQASQKQCRAAVLSKLQKEAFLSYASGELGEIEGELQRRATPWYSQAVGPLVQAANGQEVILPFFVSAQNCAYVRSLAADDIIECQSRWVTGELRRVPLSGEIPGHVLENLLPFIRFERIAAEAIMTQSVPLLREAISLHPWVRRNSHIHSIADEIVKSNATLMAEHAQYEN